MKYAGLNIQKIFYIFAIAVLMSGYGYAGDLPELGKNIKSPEPQGFDNLEVKNTTPQKSKDKLEFPDAKTFFPRIYSNYNINKYSDYLQDIKQVEPMLIGLKDVIKSSRGDKIQQYNAKVNVLNLYVVNLKEKYNNKPEKSYQSFKQLVMLDKNLTDTVNYRKKTAQYKNAQDFINSIDAVLEMIQNTD
jgi:hypothetical protein